MQNGGPREFRAKDYLLFRIIFLRIRESRFSTNLLLLKRKVLKRIPRRIIKQACRAINQPVFNQTGCPSV